MKNRILSLLLALAMMFVFVVNVSAASYGAVMPDLESKGSLSFNMEFEGKPLTDGRLNAYYVASIAEVEAGRFDFVLRDELAQSGVELNTEDLYDAAQSERLLQYCKNILGNSYLTAPIENGTSVFRDLDTGLYLVWQGEADATEGYTAMQPFLISIPRLQNGEYVLDVVADPKVPIENETEPPLPPPPPPNIPPTGQLNWPIPVLAIAGTVIFLWGWILCTGRKEN